MTRSISIRIIGLVIELFKMPIDTFPVVETTGYISNIVRENIACGFNRMTTSISIRIIGLVTGLVKMSIDTFPDSFELAAKACPVKIIT
ncbi:hypothetical protein, partial [Flavobacterium circumlabens]|uniref:hypothetical protein n=1 Tax=Flavobacterium circumlabens TaxID=2133765 RepID=UPI001064C90E